MALTADEVLDLLGKPAVDVANEMQTFSKTARALSSEHLRLIDQHPQQWVGLYDGEVKVFGKTLKSVMAQLEERGYPKAEVVVRFIDRERRMLIL